MKLMTRKKRAAEYIKELHESNTIIPGSIDKRLLSLGTNPDPDEVDRIIGHNGRTKVICDECMESKDSVLLFCEWYEDPYTEMEICRVCLLKALDVIEDQ